MLFTHATKYISIISLLSLVLLIVPFQVNAAPSANDKIEHIKRVRTFIALIQDFMNVVDSVHTMTDNPEKAAIYHMHKIEEIYKGRGQSDKAIKLFNNILQQTNNQSIRNAVYMRLGELYNKNEKTKALELYEKALLENIKLAR